jgi:uncharacterized protein YjiS (DUF1127 family)
MAAPRGLRLALATMVAVWRQRRALAALDPARLADLGLTEAQVLRESSRPVWDLPR